MVKFFLVVLSFSSFYTFANIFDLPSEGTRENRIPALIEKLKNLDMKEGPAYDDGFNQTVKAIENAVEEEKLYCAGDSVDSDGKSLPSSQKQLCMRELKKHYLNAMDAIFDLKKKYLVVIHQKQMEKMSDIQEKLRKDIEKNF